MGKKDRLKIGWLSGAVLATVIFNRFTLLVSNFFLSYYFNISVLK
jgi:hypothetical protein